ncbi:MULTISPECIES: hypothetical protein [unclassified Bradyrhizobium]|uniref:hypothetical protein n=1 Tax=unclassified Bradyrhizobium TaxID=2631580 RepID=UPI001BAD052D|nr:MULTISPECIES: hypothetical protein [unclassified Bradyrhizobium]MBR1224047.1 hypothetical protein [Bradyrhizobium sp. AUGA SZCCT0176]MBR1297730.1 hypothetical protein [Bradyrhizobium sp. AUGA SZCCT0042]
MRDVIPASCLRSPRAIIAAALLAVSCALGGCAGGGAASGSFAMATSGGGSTVAFESIDGPPPHVFDRMVGVIDSESKLRNLQIVSREGGASYRVRSYLSAQVVRGKTMIAWVWDVYDNNQQRALRLSGEEPAGKAGRDAWAAADDLVLRKIAQAGLSGLSGMINGAPEAPQPAPAPSPGRRGSAVASVEQTAPAEGVFGVAALGFSSH